MSKSSPFPAKDLILLQEQHAELKADFAALEEEFQLYLDGIDFERYDEEREIHEHFLKRFIDIQKQIDDFGKQIEPLKKEISN